MKFNWLINSVMNSPSINLAITKRRGKKAWEWAKLTLTFYKCYPGNISTSATWRNWEHNIGTSTKRMWLPRIAEERWEDSGNENITQVSFNILSDSHPQAEWALQFINWLHMHDLIKPLQQFLFTYAHFTSGETGQTKLGDFSASQSYKQDENPRLPILSPKQPLALTVF